MFDNWMLVLGNWIRDKTADFRERQNRWLLKPDKISNFEIET